MGLFGLGNNKNPQPANDRTVAKSVKLVKDASGQAAVSLEKVEAEGTLSLRKKSEAAGVSLSKHGLAGMRAQVVLLLDHSGSMMSDYQSGAVQELTERALAFGLQVDVDGSIPVIPFDDKVYMTTEVTINNYQGIVAKEIYKPAQMGGTLLEQPLVQVREMAKLSDAPIYCCIVTDGNPWDAAQTTAVVCDLARYPVFIKFLALRDVPYLQQLDDLGNDSRLLDNVDMKTFTSLEGITDEAFADAMADEWSSWVEAATAAGILTT